MKIKKTAAILSEADILVLLHPARATLGYFLAWLQSLSTVSKSSCSKIPCVFLNYVPSCE